MGAPVLISAAAGSSSGAEWTLVVVLAALGPVALLLLVRVVVVVPQAGAVTVEGFGRHARTLGVGPQFVVPFVDNTVSSRIDPREQVVPYPPQPVLTRGNQVVNVDVVVYFQVHDARAATYPVAKYIQAMEQLTVVVLRAGVGSRTVEQNLVAREGTTPDWPTPWARPQPAGGSGSAVSNSRR